MDDAAVIDAVALVNSTDFATADEATCRAVLEHSKSARGFFDAIEAMATSRLRVLHAAGGAPPAGGSLPESSTVVSEDRRLRSRPVSD